MKPLDIRGEEFLDDPLCIYTYRSVAFP